MLRIEKMSNDVWALLNDNTLLLEIDGPNNIIRLNRIVKFGNTNVSDSADEIAVLNGVTLTTAQMNALVQGVAGGYKMARGQYTMLSASDTIPTGLATVVACGASMESDAILTFDRVTSQLGNQSGAPVAGSIVIKGWMPTGAALTTPIAAVGYAGIKVNWWAVGT